MLSISRLERKRDGLQQQHDLLSEKIQRLREAHAIEASAAIRFQLEKQIGQAESERETVERQIDTLEEKTERKRPTESDLPGYPRQRVGTRLVHVLLVTGTTVTAFEALGMVLKGLRFLGEFATNPGAVMAVIVMLTALIWLTCGYVLLRKRKVSGPWLHRPPAFNTRDRVIARFILVANLAATLVLVRAILRYDVVYAQPVTEGQLGVTVAQFGEGVEMRPSAQGRELSAFVARSLRREIDLLPGLEGNVTIISGPLVRNTGEAQRVAGENRVALVIWGWVSGGDTFVPSFTFVEPSGGAIGLDKVPAWYEVEVTGGGTLELSQTVARRTSGLIEYIAGLIYLSQSDYDKAVAEFRRATALTEEARDGTVTEHEQRAMDRTLAIYHLVLGRTLAAQGRQDQARAEYEIARKCDSEYSPTYIGFGNIDYSEGRCGEALRWYELAVELAPRANKASALYARGNAHFCLGQYESAAVDYGLAIESADPDDRSLGLYHLVLGITLCRLSRSSEGIEQIRQAQQLAEHNTSLYEATTAELENCKTEAMTVAPAPTPSPTAVPTSAAISTLFPTGTPSLTATPTPFPTPVPGATVPELIAPAIGDTYRNPMTFRWRGSLRAGQAYQVTVFHAESGYTIQSGLLTEQSWTTDLPVERYAEWRWTVSVVRDGKILATSPERMFWFSPFPTRFPTPPPTAFPTTTPSPSPFATPRPSMPPPTLRPPGLPW